jgi:small conductance mechanosensitive channel
MRSAEYLPLVITVLVVTLVLGSLHILLIRNKSIGIERMFYRQLLMLFFTIVGIISIALTLPVTESTRNQVIALIGLVISAIFAFSASTIFANLMSGILLRVTKPFQIGDFITVREQFGRVAERGLFDTEIQSESRELIAIPNTYLISNPVTTLHTNGAIVSAKLSLSYDVHHDKIESFLIEAAKNTGLSEPFVHILELGNYSITYRVSGILDEVKGFITTRSNLYRSILDTLHENDIEIMSPTYMNQRPLSAEQKIIPLTNVSHKTKTDTTAAEDIVFDKAEQAEKLNKVRMVLSENIKALEESLKEANNDERARIKESIQNAREKLKNIEPDIDSPEV